MKVRTALIALVLLRLACLEAAAYPREGYEAALSTLHHNVSGTAIIVDENTIRIEHFNYDGGGPAVYFYLGTEDSQAAFVSGIPIGPLLTGTVYNDDEVIVDLGGSTTLDGYNAISVWCVDFSANFGSGTFLLPGDVTGDGFVGADDIVGVLTGWGLTGATRQQGDLTGDAFVGADDYVQVLTFWGSGSPPEAIPEPATMGLLMLGGLAVLRRRG